MKNKRTCDYIAEAIQNEILSGRMEAGQPLRQEELSEKLGYSRMPVREALQILEEQGLVRRLATRHVVVADFSERNIEEIGEALGYLSQRPDKTIRKGPDNLWALGNNSFIMFECKSEVSQERREIYKLEAGQMNNHCGWFEKEYLDATVYRIMIIPTLHLAYDADFTHDVKIMRKNKMQLFRKNILSFFKEFKEYDIMSLEDKFIHDCLEIHDLDNESIVTKYVEDVKNREQ